VEGAPTDGGAEARRQQREEPMSTTGHKGNWRQAIQVQPGPCLQFGSGAARTCCFSASATKANKKPAVAPRAFGPLAPILTPSL
jgi:hypothetical protein